MSKPDEVTRIFGGFGRYQLILCVLTAYYGIPSGLNIMGPVFIAYTPQYKCNVSNLNFLNVTLNTSKDNCQIVSADGEHISCTDGFIYDRKLFQETVITEFNLICKKRWINYMTTSLYMVGIFLGSPIFGYVSDRFGRKVTMATCSILASIQVVIMSLAPTVAVYSITRIILGFFSYGVTLSTFVYVVELTTPEWRTRIGIACQSFFAFGYTLLSAIAFTERYWRKILRYTALSYIPFFVFLFVIPESPRWLLAKGYNKEAKKIINKISKRNNIKLDNIDSGSLQKILRSRRDKKSEKCKNKQRYSTVDLFRTKNIRKTTVVMLFLWFVNGFVFYGISLNAGSLSGNIFINHALNGIFQVAGYLTCIVTMDRFGHKTIFSFMFFLSGSGLLASTLIKQVIDLDNENWSRFSVFCGFVGKMGISGTYAIIYNYSTELFPTVIRSNAIGAGSMASRIGSILAPFMIGLQEYISWLPNLFFGTFTLLASFLVMVNLPETNNRALPETIEDGEKFIGENN